jgi:hypothetical protein
VTCGHLAIRAYVRCCAIGNRVPTRNGGIASLEFVTVLAPGGDCQKSHVKLLILRENRVEYRSCNTLDTCRISRTTRGTGTSARHASYTPRNRSMCTPVGKVQLRNLHVVYRCHDAFEVESVDRNGRRYIERFPFAVAAHVRTTLAGRTVTVEDAANTLELEAIRLDIPYAYGHKLRFYAQSVLIILVACSHASCQKDGRRYRYTVHD